MKATGKNRRLRHPAFQGHGGRRVGQWIMDLGKRDPCRLFPEVFADHETIPIPPMHHIGIPKVHLGKV